MRVESKALGLAFLAGAIAATRARPPVRSIDYLWRPVQDLARSATFYCAALGFTPESAISLTSPDFARLFATPHLAAASITLTLGPSRLRLVQYEPVGRARPAPRANDPTFQHIAIVVADIHAAWHHLNALTQVTPISINGPQRLSNGVWAVKFRDPDGHPLELLQLPHQPQSPLFQRIDHSAITIRDTAASLRFYRDTLGLHVTTRSLNQGAAQHALDDVTHPLVRVTQLSPPTPTHMRLELLDYRAPPSTHPLAPFDPAANTLVLQIRHIELLFQRLLRAGAAFISPGIVPFEGAPAILLRDPDGHHLLCYA